MSAPATHQDPVTPAMELIRSAQAQSAGADLSWIQPPPGDKDWTLAPDALRMIWQLTRSMQPRHILELGSGLSTRVLSRAAAGLNPACSISSIDHDPEFNFGAWARNHAPEGARVKFHLAPLVVREFGGKLVGAYLIQRGKLASKHPVDFVVIDGPPINLGGREGTLYQVMDYARPGTVVLMDDANRPEEKAVVKAWQDNLGDAIHAEFLGGFVKGMAAVVIRQPVPTRQLWQRRFELSKKEIEAIVPQGAAILMAGEQWWGREAGPARPIVPFTEHEGEYWGEPADDAAAIVELDRLVQRGARFIVFGWHAAWWLGHYKGLIAELKQRGRKVLDNDRLTMYEVQR